MLISCRRVERLFITWSFGALGNRQAGRFFYGARNPRAGRPAQHFHEAASD